MMYRIVYTKLSNSLLSQCGIKLLSILEVYEQAIIILC